MTINLAEAVTGIANLAREKNKRFERIEARDKVFIVDHVSGESHEIEPRREDTSKHLVDVEVIKLGSLIDWARAFAGSSTNDVPPDGEIHIARRGVSLALFPRAWHRHERPESAKKKFFSEFLPPEDWVDFDAFQGWLDRIRPGMSEEQREVVDVSFSAVSATSSTVIEVSSDGAVINAEVKAGDKIAGKRQLPRHIVSRVPFGDPEFLFDARFVISARISKQTGTIVFRAAHDPNDGAIDAWVAWAEARLRTDLPVGWVILVTP